MSVRGQKAHQTLWVGQVNLVAIASPLSTLFPYDLLPCRFIAIPRQRFSYLKVYIINFRRKNYSHCKTDKNGKHFC